MESVEAKPDTGNNPNYILIPGRHHLVTDFEVEYLKNMAEQYGNPVMVWAVTSADHTGTQRNPIAGPRRLGLIEAVMASEDMPSEVHLISNQRERPNFAHYVVEDIRTQTGGRLVLKPENTVVACSTEGVSEQYAKLGFTVLSIEQETGAAKPWDVVRRIIDTGVAWQDDEQIRRLMHPICLDRYQRYHIAEVIQSIYADPLVSSSDGDITITRDYASYRAAFEDNAWRKVGDFAEYVKPGKIVDVGCATGQTIKLLGERPALFESDFYGVEVARPLYEICEQRKTNGEFGGTNVYFYQRNIMQSELFEPNSMSTVITMALTHEIESYLGHEELLRFVRRAYEMLEPGGVYINYDVVGPDEPDREVYFVPNRNDGETPKDLQWGLEGNELAAFLARVSTATRFERFLHDFRHDEGRLNDVRYETIEGLGRAVLSWGDLCEFLAKKDYLASWKSEMHETFCFYSHEQWCEALTQVGFEILPASHAITNPWLIDNRFRPAGQVSIKDNEGRLMPCPDPVTNTLLIARKPLI